MANPKIILTAFFPTIRNPHSPTSITFGIFLLDGTPLLKLREDLETFIEAAKVGHVDGVGEVEETTGSCENQSLQEKSRIRQTVMQYSMQSPKRPRRNKKQ